MYVGYQAQVAKSLLSAYAVSGMKQIVSSTMHVAQQHLWVSIVPQSVGLARGRSAVGIDAI
jgi:hypothetical protein